MSQDFEESHPPSPSKPSTSSPERSDGYADSGARRERTVALLHLARSLQVSEETGHDAVQLLDRLSSRGLVASDARSPLVLTAIILISAQQGQPARDLEHGL